eukprot:1480806-Lingulodinium_polyedra.AAC.1
MPSIIATPLPTPAPTPIRPAIGKPVVKLGPTSTFTLDLFQSVVSVRARTAKTKPSVGLAATRQVAASVPPPPPPAPEPRPQ